MRVFLGVVLAAFACQRTSVSASQRSDRPAVVFLGDSLTAGQGVARSDAYPSLIEARMNGAGLRFPVVNAGVPGDTTEDGLARLEGILRQPVAVLFVAFGANDALRFERPPAQIHSNLARIIERGRAAGAGVVLAGMKLPRSFPESYRREFEEVYPDLARKYSIPLVPFLLEGVGGEPRFNQADGLHPNAEGYRRVADVVWPVLEPVLRDAAR